MMVKMLISRVIQNICPNCFIDELKIISKLIKFNSIKKGRGLGGGEEKNNTVRMVVKYNISAFHGLAEFGLRGGGHYICKT